MTSTSYTSLRKMLKCCSHYSTTIFRYFSYNDLLSVHVANSFSKIYSPSLLYFFNKSRVQYLNKASQNGNNMSRQLSLFSYLKKSKKENIENIVKATVESLVNEIVEEEKKHSLALMKEKKISWLNIDAVNERFMCWVCQKYPQISNQNNKVTVGCSVWHRNYLIRHEDEKYKVSLFVFHTPVSNNSTVTIIFSVWCLFHTVYDYLFLNEKMLDQTFECLNQGINIRFKKVWCCILSSWSCIPRPSIKIALFPVNRLGVIFFT